MPQFVLVHGAWHGAWCWARLLPLLRSAGHEAFAVTLTGVGDRAHLLSPQIRLKTHIDDVLNLVRFEELDHVVLVGHSYGGIVITGVADVLLRQGFRELMQLIYLDAVVPHPGESWSCHQPADVVAARIKAKIIRNGTEVMLPPNAEIFGLKGADHEWVTRRMRPHPFAVYQDRLSFDSKRLASLPRTFIDCTSPPLSTMVNFRNRVRQARDWRLLALETGHDAMVSAPRELAHMLLSSAEKGDPPA